MQRTIDKIGVHIPEILLPAKITDLCKWAVVACDQYTSQPDYWDDVADIAGSCPSTLHITFPEIFLKDADGEQRIKKINANMQQYMDESILIPQTPGFILVDRVTAGSGSRKGLVLAVDLEKYDYNKGSQTLIRATEGTVLDRIPPRVKIRENALIELPHIMILIDDPEKTVIEPLFERIDGYDELYDFELMKEGGQIRGWKVDDEKSLDDIAAAIERLAAPDTFRSKYGVGEDKGILLFAVGDGNHSLASAKAHWENVKKSCGLSGESNHPARYALAEVVNVHDSGIVFEPIHRVLFDIDPQSLMSYKSNMNAGFKVYESRDAMEEAALAYKSSGNIHALPFIYEGGYGLMTVADPAYNLEVGTLQAFIDEYAAKHTGVEVDYIHGEKVVTDLGSKPGNMGFYLPAMDKHDLFKTVILEGVLPRKTFSMGEAEEKRYYLECRKIR